MVHSHDLEVGHDPQKLINRLVQKKSWGGGGSLGKVQKYKKAEQTFSLFDN